MIITIPLHKDSDFGNHKELKYFLRSIDRYLHCDYDVKLYYNTWPDWLNPQSVKHKQVDRFYPGKALKYWGVDKHGKSKPQYENYFDTLNKLWLMSMDDDVSCYFLYCYDDQLLVKDIYTHEELNQWVAMKNYWENKATYDRRGNKWSRTVMKAFDLLRERGRPLYDYETHLPRFYNKIKLQEMFLKYPVKDQIIPYAPATLYGNLYYNEPKYVLQYKNNIKAGFYGQGKNVKKVGSFYAKETKDIDRVCNGKMWINYNDKGARTTPLEKWMEYKFPGKSKFEL